MCCSHTIVYTQTRTSPHSPLRVLSTTQLNGIWACVCVRLCVFITDSCVRYTHTHTSLRVLEREDSMDWRRRKKKVKKKTNAFDCLHQSGKLCKNRREYVDIFAIDFLSVAYRFIIAPNSTNNNTNKNTTNNIKSNCLQITSINHYIGMTNLSSTQLFWKIRNNTYFGGRVRRLCRRTYYYVYTRNTNPFASFSMLPVLELYRCLAVFVDCKHTDSIPVLHSNRRPTYYLFILLFIDEFWFVWFAFNGCVHFEGDNRQWIYHTERVEEEEKIRQKWEEYRAASTMRNVVWRTSSQNCGCGYMLFVARIALETC